MEDVNPQPSVSARVCLFTTTLMLALQFAAYLDTTLKPFGLFVTGPWGESIFFGQAHCLFLTKSLTLGIILTWGSYLIAKGRPPAQDITLMRRLRISWIISLGLAWLYYVTYLIVNR